VAQVKFTTTRKAMKVIFLDIDGVLNLADHRQQRSIYPNPKAHT
jgi:hypothetical protein